MATLSTGWTASMLSPKALPSGVSRTNLVTQATGTLNPVAAQAGGSDALRSALARAIGVGVDTPVMDAPVSSVPKNTEISGVSNVNTLASQTQGIPPWLMNAISNLNVPNTFSSGNPAGGGGNFDPRVGATLAATETRIALQQKELQESNKLRIQKAKADAAALESAQNAQVQRQRFSAPALNTGWMSPIY